MRVLLINPPDGSPVFPRATAPLGLAYLAGALRHRHRVQVLDLRVTRPAGGFSALVTESCPHVVGITATTPGFPAALAVAARVKAAAPGTVVVVGGVHATLLPTRVLGHREVDFAVVGEGELTLAALCDALGRGHDPRGTPGLAWRGPQGQAVLGPPRPLIPPGCPSRSRALDRLPFPAWDLLPMARYRSRLGRCASVLGRRGCPYACATCANPALQGRGVRGRSVDHIMAELWALRRVHGVRNIFFLDNNFTQDRAHVVALCRALTRARLGLGLWCYTRPDLVDPPLLGLMARAGFHTVGLGLESGSQGVLDAMGKGLTVAQGQRAARWVKDAGLRLKAQLLLGYPGETRADLAATVALVARIQPHTYDVSLAQPYPGTALEQRCAPLDLRPITGEEPGFDPDQPRYRNPAVPWPEVLATLHRLRRRMVLRPVFYRHLLGRIL